MEGYLFVQAVPIWRLRNVITFAMGFLPHLGFPIEGGVDAVIASFIPEAQHNSVLNYLEADEITWLRERDSWAETLESSSQKPDMRHIWEGFRHRGFHVLAFTRGVRRAGDGGRQTAVVSGQPAARSQPPLVTPDYREGGTANCQPQTVNSFPIDLRTDLLTVYGRAAWMAYTHSDAVDAWELLNEGEYLFVKDMPDRATAWEKAVYLGLKSGAELARTQAQWAVGGGRWAVGPQEAVGGGQETVGGRQLADSGPPDRSGQRGARIDLSAASHSQRPTANSQPPSVLRTCQLPTANGQLKETPSQNFSSFSPPPFRADMLDSVPVLLGAIGGLPDTAYYQVKARNGFLDYGDAHNFHFYGWIESLDETIEAHRDFIARSREVGRSSSQDLKDALWLTEINAYRGELAGREAEAWDEQARYLSRAVELADQGGVDVIMPFILYRKDYRTSFSLFSKKLEPLPPWNAYVRALREAAKTSRLWQWAVGSEQRAGGSGDSDSGERVNSAQFTPTANGQPPTANRQLPTAHYSPPPVVMQWIANPVTADANKFNGCYRFQPASDPARGWRPIEGELRVYNFGEETAEGTLRWETDGFVEAVVWETGAQSFDEAQDKLAVGSERLAVGSGQLAVGGEQLAVSSVPDNQSRVTNNSGKAANRQQVSLPPMGMQTFHLRLLAGPETSGQFFRGSFSAVFQPKLNKGTRAPQPTANSQRPTANGSLREHSRLFFPLEARPDWSHFEAVPVEPEDAPEGALRLTAAAGSERLAVGRWQLAATDSVGVNDQSIKGGVHNNELLIKNIQSPATNNLALHTLSPAEGPRWIERDYDPELMLFEELSAEGSGQLAVGSDNASCTRTSEDCKLPSAWRLAPIGSTSAGRLDWHNRDYPYGYEWTSQSGVWSGMNGLRVEQGERQNEKYLTLKMELPVAFPHSQKRPIAAARVVDGLPADAWIVLMSGRPFSPYFNLQVYLIDRWGQRWWIDEQLVSNPHLLGNTKLLPLHDFDPTYFGNVIPGNPFRPEDVVEIQLELIGGAGRPAIEVVMGLLKEKAH